MPNTAAQPDVRRGVAMMHTLDKDIDDWGPDDFSLQSRRKRTPAEAEMTLALAMGDSATVQRLEAEAQSQRDRDATRWICAVRGRANGMDGAGSGRTDCRMLDVAFLTAEGG
jgi:hypothetical protein